jgi:hypothetical protein
MLESICKALPLLAAEYRIFIMNQKKNLSSECMYTLSNINICVTGFKVLKSNLSVPILLPSITHTENKYKVKVVMLFLVLD